MDICAYHIARRASAYKWFFYVFFYNNNPYYPWSTKKFRGDQCHPWEKKKPPRAYTRSGYLMFKVFVVNQLVYLSTKYFYYFLFILHIIL